MRTFFPQNYCHQNMKQDVVAKQNIFFAVSGTTNAEQGKLNARKNEHKIEINYENHR